MKLINSPHAPAPVGPYTHAVWAGNMLFCSGQVALSAQTGKLVGESIEEQTRQTLKNVEGVLRAGQLGLHDIVKTTVFLRDMNDFRQMNAVYEEMLDGHKPARSTVEVAGLPLGARVEIECIAVSPV